ncbi:extracellular solute-binding protein [Streptomyces shenzhenensis]|uniref:extracellular solute-binding protein n=1 Tax=Streptomyces shenzhenensis TaxID=943815 RepID=UPI00382273CA
MPRIRPSRRLAVTIGLAVMTVFSSGCSSSGSGSDADTIVVSTFPFGVEEFQKAVVDPFTKKTGIKVKVQTGSNSDRLSQLQLTKDRSGIDVMLLSDTYVALGAKDKLFEPVDAEDVPAIKDIADFAVDDAYPGPAYSYQLNGTIYNTDKVTQKEAADWGLYGDAARSRRVALPDISASSGQLLVAGLGETYGDGPYDIDTALQKLSGWAPGVLQFYTSSTEVTSLLSQGEIVAANSLNGFATSLVAAKEPIAFQKPSTGAYMTTNRAAVPEGAPNSEGAHAFIDYLLGVTAQSSSAKTVGDLPVNPGAEIPDSLRAVVGDIADDPVKAGYKTLDPAEVLAVRDELVKRFAREVAGH